MSDFSDWTTNVFQNGTTPAINEVNLNKNENALAKVMPELNYSSNMNFRRIMNYAQNRNQRLIDNFESLASFTTSGTATFENDFTNSLFGRSCIKVTELNDTAGLLGIYKSISAMDLTDFEDGNTSASTDYISIFVYFSDITKFDTVYIRLGDDSSNYFYFNATASTYNTGWNMISFTKSSFATTGSPTANFANVAYVFFGAVTYGSATGEYFIYDMCQLARRDSGYSDPNPFFFNDGNGNYDEEPYIVSGFGSLVSNDNQIYKQAWYNFEDQTYPTMNEIFCTVNSFCLQAETFSKADNYGVNIIWYVDSNNYLLIGVNSGTFLIYEYVSASGSTVDFLSVNISKNDRMVLDVEKQGSVIRTSLTIDGDNVYYLDYETTISDTAGCVGFTRANGSDWYAVTDFVISHNRNFLVPGFNKFSRVVRKKEDQEITSNASLQDDTELFVKLPPNKMIKIRSMIIASGPSTTPDIVVGYSISNNYHDITTRFTTGAPPGTSDVKDSNTRFYIISSPTYPAEFGIDGTTAENYINDEMFIHTGMDGNTVQFRFAQLTSNASVTRVEADSFIIAEEL